MITTIKKYSTFILTAIICIIVFLALSVYNIVLTNSINSYMRESAENINTGISYAIDDAFHQKEQSAVIVSDGIQIRHEFGWSPQMMLDDYLNSAAEKLDFLNIDIVDARDASDELNYGMYYSTVKEPHNASGAEFFINATSDKQLYMSASSIFDETLQYFVSPIVIDGDVEYVLLFYFSVDDILDNISSSFMADNHEDCSIHILNYKDVDGEPVFNKVASTTSSAFSNENALVYNLVNYDKDSELKNVHNVVSVIQQHGSDFIEYKKRTRDALISYEPLDIDGWYIFNALSVWEHEVIYRAISKATYGIIIIVGLSIGLLVLMILRKERRKMKEIEKVLYFDPLTKGENYYKFCIDAKKMLRNSKNQPSYLLELNVDKFKIINDIYGYKVGDEILIYLYKRIKKNIKPTDLVCRRNGDRFVLLVQTDSETFDAGIEEFISDISIPFEKYNLHIDISIGIYKVDDFNEKIETMNDNAILALNSIKGVKGEQYKFYTKAFRDHITEEKILGSQLISALDNGELHAFYQPKVDTKTGKIIGSEALVRWIKPNGEIISPAAFIPIAEKNLFIKKIDIFMFDIVCKKQKELLDKGLNPVPVSVNISKEFLYDETLVFKYEEIIKKRNLDPKYIELEISESTAFEDLSKMKEIISKLKAIGFNVSLDDFGTGYSSLDILVSIDIDILKLDKSLIDNYNSSKGSTLLKHIIQLSRDIGLKTVAEGVELQEQVELLKQMGCDYIQGFYFSKPLSEQSYVDYLKKHK